jgi:uncharacterized protein
VTTTELFRRLRSEIETVAIIDTHEHLISESVRLQQQVDLFSWLVIYAGSDLISAGMPEAVLQRLQHSALPLDERWAEFAPYWADIRTTGYGRALILAAHDLYDIPDITENTYAELSEKITNANAPGWYHHVLKERARIDCAILDPLEKWDPTPLAEIDRRFFRPVFRVNDYILPTSRFDLTQLEHKSGVAIHSLTHLLRTIDATLDQAVAADIAAIKVAVAYERSLRFDRHTFAEAETVFNQISSHPVRYRSQFEVGKHKAPIAWNDAKPLHDYLMHHVLHRAIDFGLPVQVHTGLHEGNGNFVENSNPLHLVNLLMEYRQIPFDLFHAGYPYHSEMATLGKNFPNAYVDLAWVHVISPWVARRVLHEYIETVPANKIFAFGGDYVFVEGAYAHSRLARENVATVLTEKVEVGYLTEDEAITLGRKLLRNNGLRFFRLNT